MGVLAEAESVREPDGRFDVEVTSLETSFESVDVPVVSAFFALESSELPATASVCRHMSSLVGLVEVMIMRTELTAAPDFPKL